MTPHESRLFGVYHQPRDTVASLYDSATPFLALFVKTYRRQCEEHPISQRFSLYDVFLLDQSREHETTIVTA